VEHRYAVVAQLPRASAFQAEGRELESRLPLNDVNPGNRPVVTLGPSVQWEWTPPCHGGDHGFESRMDRIVDYLGEYHYKNAIPPLPLSSVVEQRPVKARVAGSSPAEAANWHVAQGSERDTDNVEVGGSRPPLPTIRSITQLEECLHYKQEVGGSSPSTPTTK
jgi:hypothetical protein